MDESNILIDGFNVIKDNTVKVRTSFDRCSGRSFLVVSTYTLMYDGGDRMRYIGTTSSAGE